MTPEVYAKVKAVFSRAIDLPDSQRSEFVQQRCDGDKVVMHEVLSLLKYHDVGTIMADTPAAQTLASEQVDVEPPTLNDSYLVLRDVWEENRQILRRRLTVIALFLAAIIAISLLRLFTYHYAGVGYVARIGALLVSLACATYLHRSPDLTLRKIRIIECMVMANVGLLATIIYVRLMLAQAELGDIVDLVSVNNWSYFVWTLIILIYGIFMPNHPLRAALVVLPCAAVPGLITTVLSAIDPRVSAMLAEDGFGHPIPAPFIGALVAIYAAHLIHGARLSEFKARRLAQYRIQRMIGEGGMGQVFEAEHLLLKRSCAIKLIQPEYCSDDDALKRFEREVRATAHLTHPHTIEVYDYGQTRDGIFFFAMELLPGMNLKELVSVSGPLPPSRTIHFLSQVCQSLEEAHSQGLVHRDIKPANIFASQRGGIDDFTKLLDFGVVAEIKSDPAAGRPSKLIAGTPGYMSPEQIESQPDIDARADLYAIGAVGFFLLTGRAPFVGNTALKVMHAQVNQTPPLPSTFRTGIPADLETTLMRCLVNNRDERIATARDLRQELESCDSAGDWTETDATEWWKGLATTSAQSI